MVHLNKIELIGRVGKAEVLDVNGQKHNRFTILVEELFKGMYDRVVSTQWFNCSYWGDTDKIVPGQDIHVEGRMALHKYEGADGSVHSYTEVKVNKIY